MADKGKRKATEDYSSPKRKYNPKLFNSDSSDDKDVINLEDSSDDEDFIEEISSNYSFSF